MFTEPPWIQPRTVYIHVPFCGHHCGYCDFAVTAGKDHLIDLYLEALREELRSLGRTEVETHFIGGGTPTYLSVEQLDRLFSTILCWLPRTGDSPEFSIESTPESLTGDKLEVIVRHGVTRVSVGVQSFSTAKLNILDRRHRADQAASAVSLVKSAGLDVSLDLIFAVPGQTLAEWERDLSVGIDLSPDHISTYGLTYEKGTPLWKRQSRGEIVRATDEAELEMYLHTIDRLTQAGFEQYEVSNFARPGKRCRHNERYWANEAYHGFGVGAARYVRGCRELNVRDTETYIRKALAGESLTFQSESLPPHERAVETMAVQLRRIDGIHHDNFYAQTGFLLPTLVGDAIRHLSDVGLLVDDGSTIRLTRRGLCVADGVVEQLIRSVTPERTPPLPHSAT
jgi:oxygen-independent coproporphyrinogen III oxidase